MTSVPYISQQGNAPRNDCGPACALMLARWNGRGLDANVTDWAKSLKADAGPAAGSKAKRAPTRGARARARSIDPADDGTTAEELGAMLRQLGLTPTFGHAAQYPYIQLVHYARLPVEHRRVTNRDFLHWIVRLDDGSYHDPYHIGTRGANLIAARAVLDGAEAGAHNRVGVHERPGTASLAAEPEWLSPTDYVRLRTSPDTTTAANTIACLEPGRPVMAYDAVADAQGRGEWRRIRLPVPGVVSAAQPSQPFHIEGWAAGWFLKAADGPAPSLAPSGDAPSGDVYVPNDYLRWRSSPDDSSASNIMAVLMPGRPVATFEAQPDAQGRGVWRLVRIAVPGLVRADDVTRPYAISGWAAGWFMTRQHPPIVEEPTPRGPLLGVNTLYFGHLAKDAAARGCRFFMMMNDFATAHEIKQRYPDAVVMVRRYWGKSIPRIEDAIAQMEVHPESRLVYTFLNECDNDRICYGTPDEIRQRAELDVAMATAIKAIAPNAKFAAATFSHGTPDFTDLAIVWAMRDYYAPHYNSGLFGMDMHNYTKGRIGEVDPIWFETRWQKLFTDCDFDPSIREVYAGETGVEGGRGGFPEHGYDDAQFREWCAWHQRLQAEPLVIAGQRYPSPYVGGAIFQLGDDSRNIETAARAKAIFGRLYGQWQAYARRRGLSGPPARGSRSQVGWGHYNIRRYLPVLEEFWR